MFVGNHSNNTDVATNDENMAENSVPDLPGNFILLSPFPREKLTLNDMVI